MAHRLLSLLLLAAALALPACTTLTISTGETRTRTTDTGSSSVTTDRTTTSNDIGSVATYLSTHSITMENGTVTQDRLITATCACPGSLEGTWEDATLTLGTHTVHITPTQITWKGGARPLPAAWKKLALTESFGTITIILDDAPFGTIHPAG